MLCGWEHGFRIHTPCLVCSPICGFRPGNLVLVFKENLGLRVWGSGIWFRHLGPRESDHCSEMGGDMVG